MRFATAPCAGSRATFRATTSRWTPRQRWAARRSPCLSTSSARTKSVRGNERMSENQHVQHVQHVEPVTVLVSRKVLPGREPDYERWIRDVTKAALKYQGHLGMNVFRP